MDTQQTTGRGQLYVVSTPIGNPDDITLRALSVLSSVDAIICEERKVAQQLLRHYDINKELIELNEHNDADATVECMKLLSEGKQLALMSDAGTPLFADPGDMLVATALKYDYPVHVIPGPSSIMTALVRSGLSMQQFLYVGFLSRKRDERRQQIEMLSREPRTLVILDTPYRLPTVIQALAEVMPERRAYIGCNLTMSSEAHYYGTLGELSRQLSQRRSRAEFVIVVEGNHDWGQWAAFLEEQAGSVAKGEVNGSSTQTEEHVHQTAGNVEETDEFVESNPPHMQPVMEQNDTAHTTAESRHHHNIAPSHHRYHGRRRHNRRFQRPYEKRFRQHHRSEHEANRYDYEQPIVNYTLSNPYQQRSQKHQESMPLRQPRRKRWRR